MQQVNLLTDVTVRSCVARVTGTSEVWIQVHTHSVNPARVFEFTSCK